MKFVTEVQKACYARIKPWLKEIFGEFMIPRRDVPGFTVLVGSAIAHVLVMPWAEEEAIVCTRAYVVTGARLDEDLLRFLLLENANLVFGAFGVDESGDIVFEHAIIGSTCGKNDLRSSVMGVLLAADRYDERIVEKWGGKRALDRE